jgi:hypothetical protein
MQGKYDIHDMYASCTGPRMPHVRFPRAVPVRGNLSHWPNRVGRTLLLPRKRAPNATPNTLTDWSTGLPPSFSPNTTIEAVMKAKHMLMNMLHRFMGPISLVCDQYDQYVLAGANPSVLNQHMQDLQPWRCQLATSHYLAFPTNGPLLST